MSHPRKPSTLPKNCRCQTQGFTSHICLLLNIFNVYFKISHPFYEKEPTTITTEEGTLGPPSKANFFKIDKKLDFLIVVSTTAQTTLKYDFLGIQR
jgi:hypothetical protein